MKAVIQRVSKASVTINNEKVANIKNGLLILLGIVKKIRKKILIGYRRKLQTFVYLMMKTE